MILTGKPGIGKTTLIIGLVKFLKIKYPQRKITGFYTEEVRQKGKRIGFDLISIDGKRGTLARTTEINIGNKENRFGRYYLNMHDLDKFSTYLGMEADLVVIDEIGKMEILSPIFRKEVLRCFQTTNVLCTLGQFTNPLIDQILQFSNLTIYTVTNENRDTLMAKILFQIYDETV